jgi:polar amino acid transport system ATP-binding protein
MTTEVQSPDPQLVLENVHKSFGSNHVLRGISMSISKSEIVCIIGPSGSGKSTILRCINALTPIDAGSIKVGGIEVNDPKLDALGLRRYVGMVFQSYNLFPHRTVLQNVMMAPVQVLKQNKAEVEPRARALLAKVRLQDKESAYPGELSGGQQQRVAIARSLCMNPQVMMFDEVTAALDPETVKEVLATIREVARDGMTCILVTHEMRFAREIANTVYFTDNGRIVEFGPPREFFDHPKDERTKAFLDKVL